MDQQTPITLQAVQDAFGEMFNVIEGLRSGGQGYVCKAMRTAVVEGQPENRLVALKLYFQTAQDKRVIREINALEDFPHPNLADLIEHGSIELNGTTTRFIAWEFINGEPFDKFISRGPVSPLLVSYVGRDVARALAHIWTKRIVHRDVKPKNIMIRENGLEAVLIDLGVARFLKETPLTSQGMAWGTAGYMSPEQARAEPQLTCLSDVFSLGVSLQEALLGRHPTSGNQLAILQNIRQTGSLIPNCPAVLAELIDSMLKVRAVFRPNPETLTDAFAECATQCQE